MTDYRILSAGTERPMRYGRETGERHIVLRLQVGKRANLEFLKLTEDEALQLAQQLIVSTLMSRAWDAR